MSEENGSGSDPDRAMNYFFNSEGSANVWGYADEAYDEIVTNGKTTIDDEKRQEIYVEAQNHLLEQSPKLILSFSEELCGCSGLC